MSCWRLSESTAATTKLLSAQFVDKKTGTKRKEHTLRRRKRCTKYNNVRRYEISDAKREVRRVPERHGILLDRRNLNEGERGHGEKAPSSPAPAGVKRNVLCYDASKCEVAQFHTHFR